MLNHYSLLRGDSFYHIWLTFACTLLHKTHNFRRLPPQSILRPMSTCTISLKFQFRKQFFFFSLLLSSSKQSYERLISADGQLFYALLALVHWSPELLRRTPHGLTALHHPRTSGRSFRVMYRNLRTVPTQHPVNPFDVHCQIPGLNTETRRRRPFPGESTHKPRPYALRTSREWRAR